MIITNANPGNFLTDGPYINLVQAPPGTPAGPQTGLICINGTANFGPVNSPQPFVDVASAFTAFGNGTTLPNSLVDEAISAMPECQSFLGNRVTDGTDTAATIVIGDTTGFATATYTGGGTPAAGNTIQAVLANGSFTVSTTVYTLITGDTVATALTQLATLINNSAAVVGPNAFLQPVTAGATTIPVTALNSGTGGNSITIQAVVTGGGMTLTPTTATAMTGGAASGTVGTLTAKSTGTYPNYSTSTQTGGSLLLTLQSGTMAVSPVLRAVLTFPNAASEVFSNIVAYASVGGAYNAATAKANLLAAINGNGTTLPGSQRWTFSSGASTTAPFVGYVNGASGGTNGTTNITTATLMGVDGNTGRTGIYAFRGLASGAQLVVAALTDLTVAQTLVAFAAAENCIAHIATPSGTSTTTTIANKSTYNASSPQLIFDADWDYRYDTVSGAQRLVSPIGKIAGAIAMQPAWMTPGGKPVNGGVLNIIATERATAQAGLPQTQTLNTSPLSVGEAGLRESNGIAYLTNSPQLFFQGGYGLPHGMMSDGVTLISDVRMLKSIAYSLQQIYGRFVGSMLAIVKGNLVVIAPTGVESSPQDAVDQYFQSLLFPQPQIAAYSNIMDASNNTQTTVGQGQLIGNVRVTTLSAARFIITSVQVGVNVQIQAQKLSS
jgi:hypothetical protein